MTQPSASCAELSPVRCAIGRNASTDPQVLLEPPRGEDLLVEGDGKRNVTAAPVVVSESRLWCHRPCQHAEAKRALGEDADPVRPTQRQKAQVVLTVEQREVALHAIDVAHPLAALDQLWREVRDADVTRKSLIYELSHGAPGLLDGDLRIREMDLVEVENLAAQAAQARFRARPYAGRIEATAAWLENHLGEDHDVVPPSDCLAHQLLRVACTVCFGGVHPSHAVVKGGAHRPDQLFVGRILTMIATADLPGSVADEGDLRPILAELALLRGPLGARVPLFRHGIVSFLPLPQRVAVYK